MTDAPKCPTCGEPMETEPMTGESIGDCPHRLEWWHYRLVAERARADALATHVERLRDALDYAEPWLDDSHWRSEEALRQKAKVHKMARAALAATPEVSLADRDRRLPVGLSLEDVDLGG